MITLFAMLASVQAAPVRPQVTGLGGAQSVHVLLGTDGQTTSNCVEVADGWSCDEVDMNGPVDVHLLVDTKITALGQTEIDGAFMSIDMSGDGVQISWKKSVEVTAGHGDSLVIIRVINPDSKQAPMLRLRAANQRMEVGCADDGQFPDGIPNDGQFHCASVIRTQSLQSDTWSLEVLIPTSNGEEQSLGTFPYDGKTGMFFATVTVGNPSAARLESFALVGPTVMIPNDDPDQEPIAEAPPLNGGEEKKPPVEEPHMEPGSPGGHSSIHLWLISLCALGFGWVLGKRSRQRRLVLDAATPLPVAALDERGPVPDAGVVVISSAQPARTMSHVARQLTERRRVVIVGGADRMDVESIQSVFQVTDPDQHAIEKLLKQLLSDGGVPPVLLVLGMDAILDSGGASPAPAQDVLTRLASVVWCAVFVAEDESLPEGFASWGHDPQAGWSKL